MNNTKIGLPVNYLYFNLQHVQLTTSQAEQKLKAGVPFVSLRLELTYQNNVRLNSSLGQTFAKTRSKNVEL